MTQKVEGTELRFSTKQRGTPSVTITGITAAKSPVVTAATHGLKDGDVIYDTQSSLVLEELIGKFLMNSVNQE